MTQETTEQAQARVAQLIHLFGAVAPGTPLEAVLQQQGVLNVIHDFTQRVYTSAIQQVLGLAQPGTAEFANAQQALNRAVQQMGSMRGFNPLRPEDIPHLEIAFSASVVQVIAEYAMAGCQGYIERTVQALSQIPPQYRMPGVQVDTEWFDPNTGEPQGSNNSEKGRALAERLRAEPGLTPAGQEEADAYNEILKKREEGEVAQSGDVIPEQHISGLLPHEILPPRDVDAVSKTAVPQQAIPENTVMSEGSGAEWDSRIVGGIGVDLS